MSVGGTPRRAWLDDDQAQGLIATAQDPDAGAAERMRAEEQLLVAFRGLARGIAHRYANGRAERDDLNAVADRGLLDSIRRFDPTNGASFSTYASVTIAGSIKRYFRDSTWSVGVPRRIRDLTVQIRPAEAALEQRNGRKPTPQQLADALGVSLDDIVEAIDAMGAYQARPLAGLDGDWSQQTRLQAEELGYAIVERRETLRPALDALPERERLIIIGTYFRQRSQASIAAELGVSQVHVSRLLRKALAQLREGLSEPQPGAV
ncbi:MAG: sigma-70 family RNA polymerase sigma factor [Candidatus Nanopelagicales bacterium]